MTNNVRSIVPKLTEKQEASIHKSNQELLRDNYAFGFRINYCRELHRRDFHFGYVFLNPGELDEIIKRVNLFTDIQKLTEDQHLDHLVIKDHLLFYSVGSIEANEMGQAISDALQSESYTQIPLEYDFRNEAGDHPFRYEPKAPELLISPGTLHWRSYEPSVGSFAGGEYPPQPIYSDPIPIDELINIRNSMG